MTAPLPPHLALCLLLLLGVHPQIVSDGAGNSPCKEVGAGPHA